VGGGRYNQATGTNATVGGGGYNQATSSNATVGGGNQNTASNESATVGGGGYNTASGYVGTVSGGGYNTTSGDYAVISGGWHNANSGFCSAILGGYADTITSTGNYSHLFGIGSKLTQDSTFMVDLPHVWFGTEANGYEFPYGRGTDGQVMKTDGSGLLSWGSIVYVDSARIAANAHKLQGKDTIDLNNSFVNEGQVNSIANVMIQDAAVTTPKIADTAVTMPKIAQAGASAGQVIKWNGTAWQPGADSSMDNDWSFLVTDGADTTLQMGGQWGLARAGNTLYGNADSTHVNLGVGGTTGASGQNYKYCTVGGGFQNAATWDYATVGGGVSNIASYHCATVAGGRCNTASGDHATVAGGSANTASGHTATVAGGQGNYASNYVATVSGGAVNAASGDFAIVGGGQYNANAGYCSAILGGYADTIAATGNYSYLFGINSNLTQDSTFMVDLPHVRFGTEANGYEFPCGRGTDGQVMVTNGSGLLSWVSAPADTDWLISGSNMSSGIGGNIGVGVGAGTTTAKLDVSGSTGYNQLRMRTTYTPSSSTDANGNVGDIAWDDSYVYVKTSAGWKRSALSTW
jgi:hypothetical protein